MLSKAKTAQRYIRDLYFRYSTKHRVLNELRANWGQELNRNRNFSHISIYHRLMTKPGSEKFVDDNTWSDLNMNSLFSKIDRNASRIGSQYLYHLLHTYEDDEAVLATRFEQYGLFSQHVDMREKILLQLRRLRHSGAQFIPNIIFQGVPQRPRFYYLVYLSSFLTLMSSVLMCIDPIFFLSTITLIIINLFINHFYGRMIAGYFANISSLSCMLSVGIRLSQQDHFDIVQLKELRKLRDFSIGLRKKIGWLTIDESQLNELSRLIVSYFNYFCLFNMVSFFRSIHFIANQQGKIGRIYELIASLDAEISITSFLENLPYYCRPQINMTNLIAVSDIYHPLLINPVSNSFRLHNKSALITGSNMAGKTTFMKTIGLNIILSQNLSVCLAREASLPRSFVKSSIKRTDDIHDNKSYYYKEIEAILEFMKKGEQPGKFVFLIDEIFRGTNTVERIAAATSVLRHLPPNSVSMVTTHDIELQALLAKNFAMYHFSEQIKEGHHYFDYKIQDGPTSSRNAIHLLELKGYSTDVVQEAYGLAAKFTENGHFE